METFKYFRYNIKEFLLNYLNSKMGKKSKDSCSLLITSQTGIYQYSKKKINSLSFEQGEIISFNILGKYINF